MASATSRPAGAGASATRERVRLSPAEAAWTAAIPVALLLLAAIMLVAPALGDVALGPSDWTFLAELRISVRHEPTEQARFLLALTGPLLLSGAVVLLSRRPLPAAPGARLAARAAPWLLLAFLAFAVVAQHAFVYKLDDTRRVYFTVPTLLVALALAGLGVALLERPALLERVREATRETPRRRRVALALALLYTVLWLLTAFNTEGSIGMTHKALSDNIPIWLDEAFAALDGVYPLVEFHAQYGQLSPYVTGAAMAVFGASYGVYAATMLTGTLAAMLAVYATLRRVVGSSLLALALFAPFAATSFFKEQGTFHDRYGPSNLFSLFPIRYAGPLVLAWLVARHLDGASPRRRWPLFLVAGLALVNNPEFGVPALGATLAALAWTLERPTPRALARLAGDAALGLLAALAAVAALTLVTAGSLPHLGQLMEFASIYGRGGFGMLPMANFGFHLAVYATFAAALVLATVRAVGRERDGLLTGMLCWIGVFGLGAGSYFAGRSHPEVLINLFSPWALAVALLLVAAVRARLRRPSPRRPRAAELAVLFGFGIAVCSLAQTPTPWSQAKRIGEVTTTPRYHRLAAERYVDARTSPGTPVAIIAPLGHRIAYDLGLRNSFPYAHLASIPTVEQWRTIVEAMRADGVERVYFPTRATIGALLEYIQRAGYAITDVDYDAELVELQPAALSGG